MPHTPSAAKRLRKSERRRRNNRTAAKKLKTRCHALDAAISGKDVKAVASEARATQSALDRAAAKGYIHKNKAARLKSRLVKKLRAVSGLAPRRKWNSIMSKFKNRMSAAQVAAIDREYALLDAQFPGEYVAYIDTWAGDELSREVVAHAPDSAAFQKLLAALDSGIRAGVKLARIPDADMLSVPSVQLT